MMYCRCEKERSILPPGASCHECKERNPFPARPTFKHHITGQTIRRDLNITGRMIPEYHLPAGPEDHAMLGAIVAWCLLVGDSE